MCRVESAAEGLEVKQPKRTSTTQADAAPRSAQAQNTRPTADRRQCWSRDGGQWQIKHSKQQILLIPTVCEPAKITGGGRPALRRLRLSTGRARRLGATSGAQARRTQAARRMLEPRTSVEWTCRGQRFPRATGWRLRGTDAPGWWAVEGGGFLISSRASSGRSRCGRASWDLGRRRRTDARERRESDCDCSLPATKAGRLPAQEKAGLAGGSSLGRPWPQSRALAAAGQSRRAALTNARHRQWPTPTEHVMMPQTHRPTDRLARTGRQGTSTGRSAAHGHGRDGAARPGTRTERKTRVGAELRISISISISRACASSASAAAAAAAAASAAAVPSAQHQHRRQLGRARSKQ